MKKSLVGHYNTAACVIHVKCLRNSIDGSHSHCYCYRLRGGGKIGSRAEQAGMAVQSGTAVVSPPLHVCQLAPSYT